MCISASGLGSVASSELHVEANADGTPEVLAQKPLVKPFAVQSTTPLSGPEEVTSEMVVLIASRIAVDGKARFVTHIAVYFLVFRSISIRT